jgi:hypothetical protein
MIFGDNQTLTQIVRQIAHASCPGQANAVGLRSGESKVVTDATAYCVDVPSAGRRFDPDEILAARVRAERVQPARVVTINLALDK